MQRFVFEGVRHIFTWAVALLYHRLKRAGNIANRGKVRNEIPFS
jgi:hypothetical protein